MITVLDLGNNNVKGINDKGTLINFRSNLSKSNVRLVSNLSSLGYNFAIPYNSCAL